jgi:hypothetical protein
MKQLGSAMLVAVILAGGFCAQRASAQGVYGGRPGTPYAPPPYSPYLNLLRPGIPVYQNYYGLVRPELEFRGGIQGLQQQVNTVGSLAAADAAALGLPTTGHPIQFMNYSHYYGGGVARSGFSRSGSSSSAPTAAQGQSSGYRGGTGYGGR